MQATIYQNSTFMYLLAAVCALFLLAIVTRFLPFWLQSFFHKSALLKRVGSYLPSVIMLLLVFHALEDVHFSNFPFGLSELISLGISVLLYMWKRNLLISLVPGTIIYVLMLNFI